MPKGNPGSGSGVALPRFVRRRSSLVFALLGLFALFTLFFTLPSSIPSGPSLSKSIADHKISDILHPFKQPSHPTPSQKNSTDGESSWYSDWKWLSPFSSSVTLDEERALLPPLKPRPAIYCYYDPYDPTVQRDDATREAEKEAESALLLTWRRAWWAQGFKPILLSAAEAMNNPLYDELQRMDRERSFKKDMMRWLAWDNMGGGILAHHLVFPMGPRQDPLLKFLRRGEYPALTRWEGLVDGLFVGERAEISAAVAQALREPQTTSAKGIIDAVTSETFKVDPSHGPLSFYDGNTIAKSYSKVGDQIGSNRALGLKSLDVLINYHLHTAWQNIHAQGIAILKPLPDHTTNMIKPATKLASMLSACGESPMPATCPPNMPKCKPCDPAHPIRVATVPAYENTTSLYTIGTVPHPYTIQSLENLRDSMTVPWIRRDTRRDMWLAEVFHKLLGDEISGSPRLLKFKEAVAGDFSKASSLWLTAERESLSHELDWWFGFELPREDQTEDGTSKASEQAKPTKQLTASEAGEDAEAREPVLLKKARAIGKSTNPMDVRVRNAIEAWNLADTEAWRFSKAFLARSRLERQQWQEEESKYSGNTGADKDVTGRPGGSRTSWVRWVDGDE